jgi:hypothetical protein
VSIEQTDVVDFIGTNQSTGDVTLFIADQLDWSDEYHHLVLLQDKINSYLRFIESGEINEAYPQAVGKRIEIEIVGKYDLVKVGEEFVNEAGKIVGRAGVSLRFRRLRAEQEDETTKFELRQP